MKAREVEQRLQETIPFLTDRFTQEVSIVSIVPSGSDATVTTITAHGLTVGENVLIVGASAPIKINSITRSGAVATATTDTDHDITLGFHLQVTLSGSVESEFNDTFTLFSSDNRREFQFVVADTGPTSATGSPLLEDPLSIFGYTGKIEVDTVPTTTTFTYTTEKDLSESAIGTDMRLVVGFRFYSAITLNRARDIFETKDIDQQGLTCFVVLGDSDVSRDRSALNDGVSSAPVTGSNRQQIITELNVAVFQKITESTSGADPRDDMKDIESAIIRVLAGWAPAVQFATDEGSKLRFVNSGVADTTSAIYSHLLIFQLLEVINEDDLNIVPRNVAFRDISGSIKTDQGDQELTVDINLDKEP